MLRRKVCKAPTKPTSNRSLVPHSGPTPLCGLATKPKGTPIKMSETQNPDPNRKDIPDLTPDKDAKGGGGHSAQGGGKSVQGGGKINQ